MSHCQRRGTRERVLDLCRWSVCRLSVIALLSLLTVPLFPQDTGDVAQIGSQDVLRVGAHLACNCGCKDTVACPMALQGCSFCNKARVRIAQMQNAGMSDGKIIAVFVKENGPEIYRAGPNNYFWVIPYAALGLGLLAILFFLWHSYRPKTAPAEPAAKAEIPVDPRYMEAAEKETSSLEQ